MRVYLDTCCYNRSVEESGQESMRAEREAINYILENKDANGDVILGSEMLIRELAKMSFGAKRAAVYEKYSVIGDNIELDIDVEARGLYFMREANVKNKDSLHLACAEKGKADVFLTVDYRLIHAAQRLKLSFEVMNPVYYAASLKKG